MTNAQRAGNIHLTAVGATDPGRVRTTNEDALLATLVKPGPSNVAWPVDVSKCPVLLAVADGIGGQSAGEVASKMTLDTLMQGLLTEPNRQIGADAVRLSVEHAHEEVKRAATDERKGMASTLVAALVAGDSAYVAGVGDSRAYLVRNEALEQITRDDTLYQFAVDNDAMLLDETNAQHVLIQAIGQPRPLRVEVKRITLSSGDLLLLCSDGLTKMVSDTELAQMLTRAAPLAVLADDLIALANSHGGEDNITVVLARLADA